MKVHIYAYLTILSVLFSGTGCKGNKAGGAAKNNDIRFDSIQVEKTYHLMGNPENPNCNLQINFTYPKSFSDEKILKRLQKEFVTAYFGEHYDSLTPEEAVAKYTQDYLDDYKSLEEDFKEEITQEDGSIGGWFSYYEASNNEITYNKNNIIAYYIDMSGYTGGAHGSYTISNKVLDLRTGETINEHDIFIQGYQEPLAEILVDHITKENNLSDPKELENIGYFSIDEIYPNGNFRVDDEGIIYDFNTYEIAPYVMGITHVKVPYKEIRHLLIPDSPISSLFN